MNVSVIIPMLNEAATLSLVMDHWKALQQSGAEVLVVDGGSTDGSMERVQQAGFKVLSSARGRARQMNTGAQMAQGDIMLFLHADTQPPPQSLTAMGQGLMLSQLVWGRFDVQVEGRAWMFPIIGFFINLRSRLSGIATGDQGIFVRREAFLQISGFPDQPLMEDVEISKRLLSLSRPLCLKQKMRTSGRRWETRGVWRTIFLMWRLRWAYWRGASAQDLIKAWR
ncbi:MAG TPA: TIGR04283 family arsenosugar biosynthesis glycosyltransferase [Oligoflexus sp.]|uniref:TIGR04283 family arsenosugar biosynthesis glycosyltransferase n=1 Tax=Oligoflexus sp. TaxID=1971216 RepID=UPI002D4421E2|nr:TIGR04283 family arsenosugar biosynthesis glycosyltransferase [Oligoflexus sp.]HYX38451.1 TIGR04283 family arsenosugar biosynthesis glycosyltransferase [Oligoflexus sp.]